MTSNIQKEFKFDIRSCSPKINFPFSVGMLIAINAIEDAFLLWDAPGCALMKVGHLNRQHDLGCTLWNSDEGARFRITGVNVNTISQCRTRDIEPLLRDIVRQQGCGVVIACPFPMAEIAGMEYASIYAKLGRDGQKPFFEIAGVLLNSDWIDGYAAVLETIAQNVEIPDTKRNSNHVALVGYMMDRNEKDHDANIAELRRLLEGLGLDLVSVWLDGGRFEDLKSICTAGLILSFPYGRNAARILGKRLCADVVECDLPLGLGATGQWLRQVGDVTGRRQRAEELIEAELCTIMPLMGPAAMKYFNGTKCVLMGDPFIAKALNCYLTELGAHVLFIVAVCGVHNAAILDYHTEPPHGIHADISVKILEDLIQGNPDFDIRTLTAGGNFLNLDLLGILSPDVEVGFPSLRHHAVFDRPYIGYAGSACLMDRFIDGISRKMG